jgi:hypothetical protein
MHSAESSTDPRSGATTLRDRAATVCAVPGAVAFLCVGALSILPASVSGQREDPVGDHTYACERGELPSCTVLGLIYETGAGGTRDLARALTLYDRACEGRLPEACLRSALLEERIATGRDTLPGDEFHRVGRIADAETGGPIAHAVVSLPQIGLRVMADSAGFINLGRLRGGTYEVVATTVGHGRIEAELPSPWDSEFLLLMDREVPVESNRLGSVLGRVTDEGGVDGLANVEIEVNGSSARGTLTDPSGRFQLTDLDPGAIELTFSSLGFAERSVTVTIEPGRTVEVYVGLAPEAIELEPIEVLVGSSYLERSGFYRRARSAHGTQMTRREIEELDPQQTTDLFWRAPRVTVQRGPFGTRLASRRRVNVSGGPCRLRVYLDGVPVHDFDPETIRPEDLAGVEVYEGPSVPIEYRGLVDPDGVSPCGVVLFWTRRR